MFKKTALLFIFFFSFLFSVVAQKKPAAKANADTVKITITNLGKTINTSFPEYAPVISADGEMLVFTSRRPFTEKEIKKGKIGRAHV